MGTSTTRWNLVISTETDSVLRQHLADSSGGYRGDLSKFVEDAVRARVFELTARQAREENRGRTLEEIENAVDEAVVWTRGRS